MLRPQRGNRGAGAERTDFLVGVEQHGHPCEVLPALRLHDLQRMQDDRDAALVVRDTRPVELVALLADRLRGQRVMRIDRVHVGDQQDAAPPRALQRALDDRAVALRRRHALHAGTQRLEALLGVGGHAVQPVDVMAARLDRHHLLERLHHARLRGLCRLQQGRVRPGGQRGAAPGQ
ncbi:hypothetical protein D3C86_1486500 [compost metagenome]